MRERIRYLHYSLRTEEAYVHWNRALLRFHGRRHPRETGGPQVEAFLSWLSGERGVSTSTHRQALSVLLFPYQQVLGQQLPWMEAIGRPQRKRRLPTVLAPGEVAAVLALLDGTHGVLARLLYGTGMRIAEALQLRVTDVDFDRSVVIVRSGKGGKDRVVMLPAALEAGLQQQLHRARVLWEADARAGRGGVQMPDALERKFPRAGASWAWFWVFPQAEHAVCPRTGVERRHHWFDRTFQRAFKRAVLAAGIDHPATPHTLRHYVEYRAMPPAGSTGVMLALSMDSREAVDAMNTAAAAHGGQADVNPVQDLGFMYGRDLADPDGNLWGPFWMDPAAMPPAETPAAG